MQHDLVWKKQSTNVGNAAYAACCYCSGSSRIIVVHKQKKTQNRREIWKIKNFDADPKQFVCAWFFELYKPDSQCGDL